MDPTASEIFNLGVHKDALEKSIAARKAHPDAKLFERTIAEEQHSLDQINARIAGLQAREEAAKTQ